MSISCSGIPSILNKSHPDCGNCFPIFYLDTIEHGIEDVTSDVEAGQVELNRAAEYQAKYRRKVVILLLIAVIIGLIVTGLVWTQLK